MSHWMVGSAPFPGSFVQGGPTLVTFEVLDNLDDYRASNAAYSNSATDLRVGDFDAGLHSEDSGIRFQNVTIPQGATITAAVLNMRSNGQALGGGIPATVIRAADADNQGQVVSQAAHDALPRTTAEVAWTPVVWTTGTRFDSPDIAAVIQEVIDRAGWASGNALTILWEDNTGAGFQAKNHIYAAARNWGGQANAATLSITYA